MKCLVIGYGSIGARHARIAKEIGLEVAVVSKRAEVFEKQFLKLSEGIKIFQPDYVVVANKTNEHHETISELNKLQFTGIVLAEKPLFSAPFQIDTSSFKKLIIAYNLRFHPIISKIHEYVYNKEILSASVYAGSYLPNWRPNTDYRECYSAKKSLGGGVIRDLSHELDYMLWFCGPWKKVAALGGHYSKLQIDSDDSFSILTQTERCKSLMININYFDQIGQRLIILNTNEFSIRADLYKNILTVNGESTSYVVERDDTYRSQHLAIQKNQLKTFSSTTEALDIINLIAASEKSSSTQTWELP